MESEKISTSPLFAEVGFKNLINDLMEEIISLYKSDDIPWVVGYSGGKDSTAVLQLIWMCLQKLDVKDRKKTVHVISTDTLVENPFVSAWVKTSLDTMKKAALEYNLPITVNKLIPEISNSFWVNLIGRGYPAPRPKFRWCTERLKIQPSNRFINDVVKDNGEAIIILGTRKAESRARARVMLRAEARRVRDKLSPNTSLPSSYIYSPIEDWTNDDVWMFLNQIKNPWGISNKDLMNLYQGASPDGECPVVIDTSTPSCGDSRFGCWVCTMVDKDRSMQAMIINDSDKDWMRPLLNLRDKLDEPDRDKRDFRRMSGKLSLYQNHEGNQSLVHGPYTQLSRENFLRELLLAEKSARISAPESMKNISLISLEELEEIRRIWVIEKHELEDSLPRIFTDVTGNEYPGGSIDDALLLTPSDIEVLKNICNEDSIHFELVRELLSVQRKHRAMVKRSGIFKEIENSIKKSYYEDEQDALNYALMKADMQNQVKVSSDDVIMFDFAKEN